MLIKRNTGVLQCFEMLNVNKMEHWGSSGVQKNGIVFKINWKHDKMPKELIKRQIIAKNSYYADNVTLTLKHL